MIKPLDEAMCKICSSQCCPHKTNMRLYDILDLRAVREDERNKIIKLVKMIREELGTHISKCSITLGAVIAEIEKGDY